jgi:RND family efflux transporter MFP subunit
MIIDLPRAASSDSEFVYKNRRLPALPSPSPMNDKSALLGQLKIDQSERVTSGGRPPWLAIGIAGAVVAIGVATWALWPAPAIEVRAVPARAIAQGAAMSAASVLDASGYVVARRQATVSSKVTGKVIDVLVEEGQKVEADQVLAHIDDSNARAAVALVRAQAAELRVQLANAERERTRARDLAAKKLVSQSQLDSVEANADTLKARLETAARSVDVQQRQLDDTVVRAPFAGVITVKNAQPGEMISPLSAGGAGTRTGIGTLVDMDSLEVEVDVNENFINRVQAGQPVTAKLNAYPEWEIPAEVIAVIPTADRSKATVKVRVGFKVKDARILPDMGVRVSFQEAPKSAAEAASAPRGVLVDPAAVLGSGDSGTVFVIHGDTIERRAVKLGGSGADGVRVLSGIAAGDSLAAGDLGKLADGQKVKVIP